jgi:hypothetical protein
MLSLRFTLPVLCVVAAGLLQADATIRFEIQTVAGGVAPRTDTRVVRMKDTKGLTTEGTLTTVIDFAHQQVTVFDSASRRYAILSIAEYTRATSNRTASVMPAGAAEMLKSMKVTCDSKPPAASDDIAGIHTMEQDVNCNMTMNLPNMPQMPANMPAMSGMTMKTTMRTWWPSDEERTRVPGLWQLTDFENAQSILFKEDDGGLLPDAMKPMQEAFAKKQSITLRSVMEMSMAMGAMGGGPIMRMETNAVEISSAPIDDAEFAVPAGYAKSTYAEIENANMQATMQAVRSGASRPGAQAPRNPAASAVPAGIKAYVPMLMPVTETEPEMPAGAEKTGGTVQVLATIDAQGGVIGAEAVAGPAGLRAAAVSAVKKWTYRPVLREGVPVTAYTDAQVFFFSDSGPVAATLPVVDDALVARITELQRNFPRTSEQVLADDEEDATGRDAEERFGLLPRLAVQATHLEVWDKAKAFVTELMAALPQHVGQPDYGDAYFDAHMTLGLIALHNGDVATAGKELVESAHMSGSPVLSSFGPDMGLAEELLRKGESGAVLNFIHECRTFWTMGSAQLDRWSETIRQGGIPVFPLMFR